MNYECLDVSREERELQVWNDKTYDSRSSRLTKKENIIKKIKQKTNRG